jgi:hypothetical protein
VISHPGRSLVLKHNSIRGSCRPTNRCVITIKRPIKGWDDQLVPIAAFFLLLGLKSKQMAQPIRVTLQYTTTKTTTSHASCVRCHHRPWCPLPPSLVSLPYSAQHHQPALPYAAGWPTQPCLALTCATSPPLALLHHLLQDLTTGTLPSTPSSSINRPSSRPNCD